MAPEFIPFIVCGLLIVASAVVCIVVVLALLFRRRFLRVVKSRLPRIGRNLRLATALAVLAVIGLLAVTAVSTFSVRQQYFLNEPLAMAAPLRGIPRRWRSFLNEAPRRMLGDRISSARLSSPPLGGSTPTLSPC